MAKQKANRNASGWKAVLICVILVGLIAGYYFYLSQKADAEEKENPKITKVDEVLSRNLENYYPPTPKEVVKYFSEITKCFYNEEYSQGQLEELADKIRQLYDVQLLENNEWGAYMIQLQGDIQNYKENERKVSNYIVSSSTDVEEFVEDGYEWARLHCIYNIRQGGSYASVNEVFLLRKDENGHWKIFGWELVEENE